MYLNFQPTGWLDYIELNAEKVAKFCRYSNVIFTNCESFYTQKIENTSSTTLAQINQFGI